MQIHELPSGVPATGMTFAGDTGTNTQKIDYDALADAILNKITSKDFTIQSESQTIIEALDALGDASKQDVANNLVTTAEGFVLDARQGKTLEDEIVSIATVRKKTNSTYLASFMGLGAQIDSNRIMCMLPLPFATADSSYTVEVTSCVILGVSNVDPSTVVLDSRTTTGVRLTIPYTGTVRSAYAVQVGMKIIY